MTLFTTKPNQPCCVPGCDRPMLARCSGPWAIACDRPVCVVHGRRDHGSMMCPACAELDDHVARDSAPTAHA